MREDELIYELVLLSAEELKKRIKQQHFHPTTQRRSDAAAYLLLRVQEEGEEGKASICQRQKVKYNLFASRNTKEMRDCG